jgi:hypothetical protein
MTAFNAEGEASGFGRLFVCALETARTSRAAHKARVKWGYVGCKAKHHDQA